MTNFMNNYRYTCNTFIISFSVDQNYMFSVSQQVINNSSSKLEIYPKFGKSKNVDHSTQKTILVDLPIYIKYNLINIGPKILETQ